ncbi:AT-rich interactive domain-containing protein [Homalodisca vitripennis]|nr:AT-rich interactive domain-containing protein [Homalodisca vitripennis]
MEVIEQSLLTVYVEGEVDLVFSEQLVMSNDSDAVLESFMPEEGASKDENSPVTDCDNGNNVLFNNYEEMPNEVIAQQINDHEQDKNHTEFDISTRRPKKGRKLKHPAVFLNCYVRKRYHEQEKRYTSSCVMLLERLASEALRLPIVCVSRGDEFGQLPHFVIESSTTCQAYRLGLECGHPSGSAVVGMGLTRDHLTCEYSPYNKVPDLHSCYDDQLWMSFKGLKILSLMQRWGSKREMMGDDPPYLAVGTEVSAKYKGAFCEAKVRKIVRSVKCKVCDTKLSLFFNVNRTKV